MCINVYIFLVSFDIFMFWTIFKLWLRQKRGFGNPVMEKVLFEVNEIDLWIELSEFEFVVNFVETREVCVARVNKLEYEFIYLLFEETMWIFWVHLKLFDWSREDFYSINLASKNWCFSWFLIFFMLSWA